MDYVEVSQEIIINQIKYSIQMFELVQGDQIIYIGNHCNKNNIWIFFTSLYLGNIIYIYEDNISLEKFNIIACEYDYWINHQKQFKTNFKKLIIYNLIEKLNEEQLQKFKIYNVTSLSDVYGNYTIDNITINTLKKQKTKKEIDCKAKYIEQVLVLFNEMKYHVYLINYLVNTNVYVISYKYKKKQILNDLKAALNTEDVAVVVDAKHQCVTIRGIKDEESSTVTMEYSGKFLNEDVRKEFLGYVNIEL